MPNICNQNLAIKKQSEKSLGTLYKKTGLSSSKMSMSLKTEYNWGISSRLKETKRGKKTKY